MRMPFLILLILVLNITMADQLFAQSQSKRIVIAAGTLLDGKGKVVHNTRIVIEEGKIVAIDPKAGTCGLRLARSDGTARLD